jgi:hypothetical protein
MFLRSSFLEFTHPSGKKRITVALGVAETWKPILEQLHFQPEDVFSNEDQVVIH